MVVALYLLSFCRGIEKIVSEVGVYSGFRVYRSFLFLGAGLVIGYTFVVFDFLFFFL